MNAPIHGVENVTQPIDPYRIIRTHVGGVVDHVVVDMQAPIINATAAAVNPQWRAAAVGDDTAQALIAVLGLEAA